ncbi:MAG: hypothetical protein ACYTGD_18210 [Planctomycetota bacterium]|jgi:hypothetical protein
MNGEQLKRAQEIFEELADLPAPQRGAILDERCGDDQELRAFVEPSSSSWPATIKASAISFRHRKSRSPSCSKGAARGGTPRPNEKRS